jgi:hypothetical protein
MESLKAWNGLMVTDFTVPYVMTLAINLLK